MSQILLFKSLKLDYIFFNQLILIGCIGYNLCFSCFFFQIKIALFEGRY